MSAKNPTLSELALELRVAARATAQVGLRAPNWTCSVPVDAANVPAPRLGAASHIHSCVSPSAALLPSPSAATTTARHRRGDTT